MKLLSKSFFARNTEQVARELLGKILVHKNFRGKIVETEAYFGTGDPASHAFKGPTHRSKVMFGPPGRAYVYFTYGMHWMLNVVTETDGKPGAVLIRALESGLNTNGPAKLTKAFGITGKLNGIELTKRGFCILDSKDKPEIASSKRIGVSKDLNRNLRFYIKGNSFVSKNGSRFKVADEATRNKV